MDRQNLCLQMTLKRIMDNAKRLRETRQYWDQAAPTFDLEADHGLQHPQVLHAWTELLKVWIPAEHATVLDVGCGTGSLSLILARLGHAVIGIDISINMLTQAKAKAHEARQTIYFSVMDAVAPQFAPCSLDIVVCRHVLWALPEPARALQSWVNLLKPQGRLILIEGYWNTGGGLHVPELVKDLPSSLTIMAVQSLSDQPVYWGKVVTDERYVVIADHHPRFRRRQ